MSTGSGRWCTRVNIRLPMITPAPQPVSSVPYAVSPPPRLSFA